MRRVRPAGPRSLLRRTPLRLRLVAGFAAAMAVVLTASGAFVYWRVEYALDRRLDTDLTAQAAALQSVVAADGTVPATAVGTDPERADFQVLDERGAVVSAGSGLGPRPLLAPGEVARAHRGPVTVDVGSLLPISERPLRLLARPLAGGSPLVLVVGVRRDARDEALRELIAQLGFAALGTLLVTTVVGERLAGAALRPAERYRTQAQAIAAGASGVRLDVPAGRDDEVSRLGDTLNEMLAALERGVQRERRFVDDASHELRTPLTLLLTRLQLTLTRPRSVAEHEEVLRELQTDVAALSVLAEDLLALGSAPALGDAEAGDVARAARDLPTTTAVHAPEPGTTPVGLPDGRLRQVLLNLVTNAEVHGAAPVRVDVRRGPHDLVVTTVTDAGAGIAGEFLPAAVERFSRAGDARARPGAGLGLALVDALVDGHGGELRLCSRGSHHRYQHRFDVACAHPDGGTTATVLLPLRGAPTAP